MKPNIRVAKLDKIRLLCATFALLSAVTGSSQIPKASCGEIVHWEKVQSRFVEARNVDIWLPPGYDSTLRYPVLYMNDGQMLFDTNITWNKREWGVDEVLCRLIHEGAVRPCIVVGVWSNGPLRPSEYFPQKAVRHLKSKGKELLATRTNHLYLSDNYLQFLAYELKPKVDSQFATLREPAHTFVAGSSTGGLNALYAICERPDVFGAAACLSTHWPAVFSNENNPIPKAVRKYLKKHLPRPQNHRIYFDHGTDNLDALYGIWQKKVDRLMRRKCFKKGKNWESLVFEGESHTEIAWNKRLHVPLQFLLGKPANPEQTTIRP
jgi:enterochelin esterase-like enzyme